ncbi:MAG: PhzF family phenazine biosynthesis protein [Thermomicrobiales bacterium]
MDTWTFRIVDVFTGRPLAGNQLAVFEDATDIPEHALQPLAKEIGYAETVFVYPAQEGGDARIRIFTPENEIPFAGHPTLGTAIVLAQRRGKAQIVLETGRGPVPVRIDPASGPAARGTMQQPLPTIAAYPAPDALLAALGVKQSLLPVTLYDNGIPHVYVILESPQDVAAVEPDFAALARLARETSMPVVGFNTSAGSGLDWKARMFAPADGVPEDAATGSAAGPLALHLAQHELIPWGTEIRIAQGAEIGRPSALYARVTGNADRVERIEVSGFAVPVGGGWFDAALLRDGGGA